MPYPAGQGELRHRLCLEDSRAGGVEEFLLAILVERARAEATSGRETTQGIRQPRLKVREVVKGHNVSASCGYEEVVFVARRGS